MTRWLRAPLGALFCAVVLFGAVRSGITEARAAMRGFSGFGSHGSGVERSRSGPIASKRDTTFSHRTTARRTTAARKITASRTRMSSTRRAGKTDSRRRSTLRDKPISRQSTASPTKFEGKPTKVVHNPEHKGGELSKMSEHKSVLVERDGNYYRRSYYSKSEGGTIGWYWYEVPLEPGAPVLDRIPYVATCKPDSDDCQVAERNPSLQTWPSFQDVVDWWNGPLKLRERCDPSVSYNQRKKETTITCVANHAAGCSHKCTMYDAPADQENDSGQVVIHGRLSGDANDFVRCKCE